jgi:hypothetical protein
MGGVFRQIRLSFDDIFKGEFPGPGRCGTELSWAINASFSPGMSVGMFEKSGRVIFRDLSD